MSEETLNEKDIAVNPDKWYIVDAKTHEPLRPPQASFEKAQDLADSIMFEKPIKIMQGKNMKWKLKEAHELYTPVMVGTPEERLEALNLWAGIVTSLKKISELPSVENRTALLNAAQTEAKCALDRVVNIVHVPVPTSTPATVPAPSMSYEEQEFKSEVTAERLLELAGVQRRSV